MFPYSAQDLVFVVASSLAVLGVISVAAGIITLVTKSSSRAVQSIANQTAKLAQKGLTEEISGLVGNASSLMEALNNLVRTSAGIGIFLVLFGFLMMVASYFMVKMF